MNNVIEVKGLRKSYGNIRALDGIDIEVKKGEIFGLIGHNGAGKTTAIECMLGIRRRDSGDVSVLGLNPEKDRRKLFCRVGVQFQHSVFQNRLKVGEACEVTAALYSLEPGRESAGTYGRGRQILKKDNWMALLRKFSLDERVKAEISELSGGEKQRLAVALALIPHPEVVFLDELTTGLDPASRRDIWKYLKELNDEGITIVLTSHYMDEVEHLCGRIAVLKKGRVETSGTPGDLIRQHRAKNLDDVFMITCGTEYASSRKDTSCTCTPAYPVLFMAAGITPMFTSGTLKTGRNAEAVK